MRINGLKFSENKKLREQKEEEFSWEEQRRERRMAEVRLLESHRGQDEDVKSRL